jgi:hypothetical protein
MYDLEIQFPPIRMEEEEEIELMEKPRMGFAATVERTQPAAAEKEEARAIPDKTALHQLLEERRRIVDAKLSTRSKLRLLQANRDAMIVAQGGNVTSRKRENVVYSILIFGGVVTVILALLTVQLQLPAEITLTFVGTVLGGTIATVAQKIGKI